MRRIFVARRRAAQYRRIVASLPTSIIPTGRPGADPLERLELRFAAPLRFQGKYREIACKPPKAGANVIQHSNLNFD
jgi:hypothetical protein